MLALLRFPAPGRLLHAQVVAYRKAGPIEVGELVTVTFAKAGQVYSDDRGVYRWITVHPNGKDEPGQPVKIRESKNEPGTWHVVGGAGGHLNYLRITGLATPEEYAKRAREKAREKKEKKVEQGQKERERKAGLSEEEKSAEAKAKIAAKTEREQMKIQHRLEEQEFLSRIAKQQGWKDEEWQFDAEGAKKAGASQDRVLQMEAQFHKGIMARAYAILDESKAALVAAQADALHQLPLHTDDEKAIGIDELLDGPAVPRGKGFVSPTKELSDAEVTKALAARDRMKLQQDADRLAAQLQRQEDEKGERDKLTEAALGEVQGHLKMIALTEEAQRTKPEDRAKEREDVLAALAGQQKFIGQQRADPEIQDIAAKIKDGDPLSAQELERFMPVNKAMKEVKHLQERRDDLDVMDTASAAPVIKPEARTVALQKREAKIKAISKEEGPEAADVYRARIENMEKALKKYRDEMKQYKEAKVLQKPRELEGKVIQDAEETLKLLAAEKALKRRQKALAEAEAKGTTPDQALYGKPAFTPTGKIDPAALDAIKKEINSAVETTLTQSFLSRIESPELLLGKDRPFTDDYDQKDLHRALEEHVGAGSYNVLNNAALSALKDATLSREAADLLGSKGAAQLIARQVIAAEGKDVAKRLADKLGEYHVKANVMEADERLREIDEALNDADDAMQMVTNPSDLAVAAAANRQRAAKIEDARQIAGTALGEYEATAALVQALAESPAEKIDVVLGPIGTEAAVRQLRSLGLAKTDYEITSDGTNHFASIKASGFEKMMEKPDPARAKLFESVMAIKRGEQDDPNWQPKGAIVRAASTFRAQGLTPPPLSEHAPQLMSMTRDDQLDEHIARRVGDGEDIEDILPDVYSHINDAAEAFRPSLLKRLNTLFPASEPATTPDGQPIYHKTADGKVKLDDKGQPIQMTRMVKGDRYREEANKLVETYRKSFGDTAAPIQAQSVDINDDNTHEALVRAITQDPRTLSAYKPIGELTHQDQRALRSYFASEVAKPDKVHGLVDAAIAAMGPEPEHDVEGGLFGGKSTNPEWLDWNQERQKIYSDHHFDPDGMGPRTSAWDEFVGSMGSAEAAYSALQDHMRSRVNQHFHAAYTGLTGKALRMGKRDIAHAELFAGYRDPEQRAALQAKWRERLDAARNRVKGKYATGSVAEKMERDAQSAEIARQHQGTMFATPAEAASAGAAPHERFTLGDTVENQIGSLLTQMAPQFRPMGGKVDLIKDRHFGGRFMAQQRAIKSFLTSKRMAAALGTGSGKSAIMINSLTEGRGTGKMKRGLFVVPAGVVEQMGPEFNRFADPQKTTWAANPGAPRTQRLAEHGATGPDAVVHSHQAFRDDQLHLLSKHWKMTPEAATEKFMTLDRAEAAKTMAEVWKANGIKYDMLAVDEGHGLLDRAGKPDSLLSRVARAISDNTPYYMSSTADPVKNDVSELQSLMSKLTPGGRYDDAKSFNRRYGVNTTASAEALKREIAPYVFASEVPNQNIVKERREVVKLHPKQQAAYDGVLAAFEKLRAARLAGKTDVEAAKILAPARFKDAPADQHETIAKSIMRAAGTIRESRLQEIVDASPAEQNAKLDKLREIAKEKNRTDKPLVVFTHRLAALKTIADELKKEGYSVETYQGSDGQEERGVKRRAFQEGKTQVLVTSDAGSSGINLQRGQTLVQFDTPYTAMTHAQRRGRINRMGQLNPDIELVDLATDTPFEVAAKKRVDTKYALREILTDPAESLDDTGMSAMLREARAESAEKKARTAKLTPLDKWGAAGSPLPKAVQAKKWQRHKTAQARESLTEGGYGGAEPILSPKATIAPTPKKGTAA